MPIFLRQFVRNKQTSFDSQMSYKLAVSNQEQDAPMAQFGLNCDTYWANNAINTQTGGHG